MPKAKYFSINQFNYDADKKIFLANTKALRQVPLDHEDIVIIGEKENKTFKLISTEVNEEDKAITAQKVYQSTDNDYFIFLDVMDAANASP